MHDFFVKLFSENNGSPYKIELFNFWHFFYLIIIFGTAILVTLLLKNKSQSAKEKACRIFAYITVGLYIADFFIMPLSDSYDGISSYKLPFNICTLMAVLAPFAQFNKRFKVIKTPSTKHSVFAYVDVLSRYCAGRRTSAVLHNFSNVYLSRSVV